MAATYTPIASITLGAATSSVTFNSIPSTYTDLVLTGQVKVTTGPRLIQLIFNNDSGSNYSVTRIYGNGSSVTSDRYSTQSFLDISYVSSSDWNIFNHNIQNYSNSTTHKTIIGRWSDASFTLLQCGLWRSTSAITSINITPYESNPFVSGSTFNLYGILGANA